MKVAIISGSYPSKGFPYAGTFVHEQARALQRLGIDVYVISPVPFAPWPFPLFNSRWRKYAETPEEGRIGSIDVYYPRYISYRSWRAHSWPKRIYKGMFGIFKKVLRTAGGIDIIHAHFVIPEGLATTYVGEKFGIPVVITAHGSEVNMFPDYDDRLKKNFSSAIARADAVVAVSYTLQKKIETYSSPRLIQTIPMGVDTESFKPADSKRDIREQIGIPADTNMILFVGQLTYEKGVFDLIQAFRILREQNSNATLAMVGDTRCPSEIASYIQSNNLTDRIRLIGVVPHAQVKDWMNACDVFVLPSYSEGLPTVVVEAMACGRAVVATPVGGVPEIIRDGENGVIVPVKDPQILADKLKFLIGNPDLREALGRSARETVLNGYDVITNAKKLVDLYYRLTQR